MIDIPREGEVHLEFRVIVKSYGFYHVIEASNTRAIARALELHLGHDGYELYDEEGRLVIFDSKADDGHHEGHDQPIVRLEPL